MELDFWTIRRMALLGAAFGAAVDAPELIREPTAFTLGGLTVYVMIGAILGALAHRAFRVSGSRMTTYIIISVIAWIVFSFFLYYAAK